jgi:hypothetical protein
VQNLLNPTAMKTRILLMAIGATVLGSCSTMYKSGPTPDDVYFSPAPVETGYVGRESYDRNVGRGDYEDGYVDMSDRYLRMKSSSRRRWSAFDDDFMYWNNPMWNNSYMFNSWRRPGIGWSGGFGPMAWGNPYMGYNPFMSPFNNPYMGMGAFHGFGTGTYYGYGMGSFGFNNFYGSPFSPFYYGTPVVVVTKPLAPVNPRANGPRVYNLSGYGTGSNSNPANSRGYSGNGNSPMRSGVRTFGSGSAPTRSSSGYINTESSRPRGGYNNSDNSNRSSSNPVRTFESSGGSRSSGSGVGGGSSSGGSGGSSSGGSAPVRSFPRGGGR